jgi:hypothetical protein
MSIWRRISTALASMGDKMGSKTITQRGTTSDFIRASERD